MQTHKTKWGKVEDIQDHSHTLRQRPIPLLLNIPSLSPTLSQIKASFVCENMFKHSFVYTHTHTLYPHVQVIFSTEVST